MEMNYGGAMVLPSSYVVMDQDEMTYVEGGWGNGVIATCISAALKIVCGTFVAQTNVVAHLAALGSCLAWAYNAVVAAIVWMIANPLAGALIVVGATIAIDTYGKKKNWW